MQINTAWTHQQRAQPGNYAIQCSQVRPTLSRAIDDQELLLDQQRLSNDRPCTAGSQQPGNSRKEVEEQNSEFAHGFHIVADSRALTRLGLNRDFGYELRIRHRHVREFSHE